jgi:D-alanyl-lipoteichoic acid acyltransferase DltB (MBOAT superfamily)
MSQRVKVAAWWIGAKTILPPVFGVGLFITAYLYGCIHWFKWTMIIYGVLAAIEFLVVMPYNYGRDKQNEK